MRGELTRVECESCGATFWVRRAEHETRNRGRFCSPECSHEEGGRTLRTFNIKNRVVEESGVDVKMRRPMGMRLSEGFTTLGGAYND